MKLLLDTHVFLWFISGDLRLPDGMLQSVCEPSNEVYLSVVSLWEAIIKYHLERLPLPQPPEVYLPIQRERHLISSLLLIEASVAHLGKLPSLHGDHFDRMLVCQAIEHDLVIVTVDDTIRAYPVKVLDAT
jgi:PIN domain nuclease of toxin-antitoxin system